MISVNSICVYSLRQGTEEFKSKFNQLENSGSQIHIKTYQGDCKPVYFNFTPEQFFPC